MTSELGRSDLLDPGRHREGVKAFGAYFGISPRLSGVDLLREILLAYAQLPYENLSKIIKHARYADPVEKMRMPEEVIEDHMRYHLGGTCFALTFFLHTLLIHHGFDNYPVMADMRYGPNTHSALIVHLEGKPHLVDPGYLLNEPLPLTVDQPRIFHTPFSGVQLRYRPERDTYEVYTFRRDEIKWRYRFRNRPIPLDRFAALWQESFTWNRMRGLVLTKTERDRMIYVHKTFLRETRWDTKRNEHIRINYHRRIHEVFGIAPEKVEEALAALEENLRRERESGLWVPKSPSKARGVTP